MPLSHLLEKHIIKSTERFSKSNIKVYCKACVEVLDENEVKKNCFPNKTDRIIQHLKKCVHFADKTLPEEKEEISALPNNKGTSNEKRPASPYDIVSNSSKSSSARKVIVRSSSYGPLDNYTVRLLSQQDEEKVEILLLRLMISCGIPFHWINNPETKELFQFLNPLLKLPDRRVLSR
ncbi:hypothetical protein F8M41_005105 [Gigaspora margarita]|uniref:BED-type domain-containing protein n=1 Tax=Gigaspora margarita TaxID=4874 RepID=A0A8H4A578_GIGMA|nr:hypothetical protein F8M41_005105 [Gigaspora margarita]